MCKASAAPNKMGKMDQLRADHTSCDTSKNELKPAKCNNITPHTHVKYTKGVIKCVQAYYGHKVTYAEGQPKAQLEPPSAPDVPQGDCHHGCPSVDLCRTTVTWCVQQRRNQAHHQKRKNPYNRVHQQNQGR